MTYKVVLHRTEEGIRVSVPALPGCWLNGNNEEKALDNQTQSLEVRKVEVLV